MGTAGLESFLASESCALGGEIGEEDAEEDDGAPNAKPVVAAGTGAGEVEEGAPKVKPVIVAGLDSSFGAANENSVVVGAGLDSSLVVAEGAPNENPVVLTAGLDSSFGAPNENPVEIGFDSSFAEGAPNENPVVGVEGAPNENPVVVGAGLDSSLVVAEGAAKVKGVDFEASVVKVGDAFEGVIFDVEGEAFETGEKDET